MNEQYEYNSDILVYHTGAKKHMSILQHLIYGVVSQDGKESTMKVVL